jgi:hypothetical protein
MSHHLETLTKKLIYNKTNNYTQSNRNRNRYTENPNNDEPLLKIRASEFNGLSPATSNKIIELLKSYVKMDKTFRLKHEALKTLYNAYLDLYQKYQERIAKNNVVENDPTDHKAMLKNIHLEMKNNNSNLYRERLLILKKIKDHPELDKPNKNKLCGKLIAIFKSPPSIEYQQQPLLSSIIPSSIGLSNNTPNKTITNLDMDMSMNLNNLSSNISNQIGNSGEKINVDELDDAYLQKHNELMVVFKAYQNLYKKVLNYKDELERYKQLPTGSSITREHMKKMVHDQRFVMNMIDRMQDNLISNNVIDPSEKIPVTPVVNNPENIKTFNNTMRDQIRHIIDRKVEDINPNMKQKIEKLLEQYSDTDCNDIRNSNTEFCKSGAKILLLKSNNLSS